LVGRGALDSKQKFEGLRNARKEHFLNEYKGWNVYGSKRK